MKRLAKALEGIATVRLVSIDRDEAAVRRYIQANNIDLEVAFDSGRDARKAYKVSVTPTLFLLNSDNVVQNKHTGVLSESDLQELIGLAQEL